MDGWNCITRLTTTRSGTLTNKDGIKTFLSCRCFCYPHLSKHISFPSILGVDDGQAILTLLPTAFLHHQEQSPKKWRGKKTVRRFAFEHRANHIEERETLQPYTSVGRLRNINSRDTQPSPGLAIIPSDSTKKQVRYFINSSNSNSNVSTTLRKRSCSCRCSPKKPTSCNLSALLDLRLCLSTAFG